MPVAFLAGVLLVALALSGAIWAVLALSAQPAAEPAPLPTTPYAEVHQLLADADRQTDPAEAEQMAARALERCRAANGPADLEAECLLRVGRGQHHRGQDAAAVATARAALALRSGRADTLDGRLSLLAGRAGLRHADRGSAAERVALYTDATDDLARAVQLLGGTERDEAAAAVAAARAGYPVREALKHAQAIRNRTAGKDADPQAAERVLERAATGADFATLGDGLKADVRHARGSVRYQQRKYADALADFTAVVELRQRTPGTPRRDVARAMSHLALCHEGLGEDLPVSTGEQKRHFDAARGWNERVLATLSGPTAEETELYLKAGARLAGQLIRDGEKGKAGDLLKRALAGADGLLDLPRAQLLINLGSAFRDAGDHARAKECYDQAHPLLLNTVGPTHLATATVLLNQGYLDARLALTSSPFGGLGEKLKTPERVERKLREAIVIARDVLGRYAAGQSEAEHLKMLGVFAKYTDAYLSFHHTLPGVTPELAERAYAAVLPWKGTAYARLVWERRLRATTEPEAHRVKGQLADALGQLASLPASDLDPADAERRSEVEGRCETLVRRLDEMTNGTARELDFTRWTPADVRARLPADAVLIDFHPFTLYSPSAVGNGGGRAVKKGAEQLAAFVVGRNGCELVFLGESAKIESAVNKWLKAVEDPGKCDCAALEPLTRTVSERVWEKLAKAVGRAAPPPPSKKPWRLYVSPAGPVAGFPFTVFPGKAEGAMLIDECEVAILPVPGLSPAARPTTPPVPRLLSVSAVEVGGKDAVTKPLVPLLDKPFEDASRDHATHAKSVFQGRYGSTAEVDEFQGDKATADAFLSAAPLATHIDLFTHGFQRPTSAADAHPGAAFGVAFAGANESPQKGTLTADRLTALDLGRTEMAVLTACQSAGGKPVGGEGAVSVQRAFQVAGCRGSVAAVWKVSPSATRDLLNRFYTRLLADGLSPAAAVRAAQLDFRKKKSTSRDNAHPYYWAAWSVCESPEPPSK